MSKHNEELKVEISFLTIGSYVATLIDEKHLEKNCIMSQHFEDYCDTEILCRDIMKSNKKETLL